MPGGLEGQLHDALVLVRRSQVEDREDVLPARADVRRLGVNHLGDAAHHHVPDCGRPEETDPDQFKGRQFISSLMSARSKSSR